MDRRRLLQVNWLLRTGFKDGGDWETHLFILGKQGNFLFQLSLLHVFVGESVSTT